MDLRETLRRIKAPRFLPLLGETMQRPNDTLMVLSRQHAVTHEVCAPFTSPRLLGPFFYDLPCSEAKAVVLKCAFPSSSSLFALKFRFCCQVPARRLGMKHCPWNVPLMSTIQRW